MTELAAEQEVAPFALRQQFTEDDLDVFLGACLRADVSDIRIQSGDYIWLEWYGRLVKGSNGRVPDGEVQRALAIMYGGQSSVAVLGDGNAIDGRYNVRLDRKVVIGFRLAACRALIGGVPGISIVLRSIPGTPPPLASLNLPKAILRDIAPPRGMVLVVGPTGSGKSTTIASVLQDLWLNRPGTVLITAESPPEFVLGGSREGQINPLPRQVHIGPGHDISDFGVAMDNTLRSKPSTIFIGEVRNKNEIGTAITAALTGHACYATLHADGPEQTVNRLIQAFQGDEQAGDVPSRLMGSLHMVLAQKLMITGDGKRHAIHEWLVFGPDERDRLESQPYGSWKSMIRRMVQDRGQTFAHSAMPLLKEGLITREQFIAKIGISPSEVGSMNA